MTRVLTQRAVEAAKPKTKRYGKPDGVVPGMQLVVHPSGQKSFTLFARIGGKQINVRLGPAGVLTLAQARDEARMKLGQIASGTDPRTVKREAQSTETFAIVAERFIERHAKVRNRSWREIERLIQRDALPRWRHRPIDSITRHDVIALLDAIVDRGAPVTANRVLGAVRRLFNWCIERGMIDAPSPCDRVRKPSPETARDRVLDDGELLLVWRAAETLDYPIGPFIRLLILSGQRRCEVSGMRWSEFDPDLALWTLPRERVKSANEHCVPVASAMRAILIGLPRMAGCDFAFTKNGETSLANFSGIKSALDAAIIAMNSGVAIAPWTFHDLRRTVASGMARLGVGLPVIERALNHRSGVFKGVTGVYARYDYRTEMLEALQRWERHVLELVQSEKLNLLRIAASR
jgi:integrase